jgi:hypothetical protein
MPIPPRRHWFQFGLATMFVVVTVVAIPLGWPAWERRLVKERQQMVRSMSLSGVAVLLQVAPPDD